MNNKISKAKKGCSFKISNKNMINDKKKSYT